MNDMLYKKIEDLGLSVRSTNCLHGENITLVSELVKLKAEQVLKTRNLGKKQLSEIEDALARHGLEFGTHVPAEGTEVKIDLDADYILQAYTREYKNINNVYRQTGKKDIIACITTFKHYEEPAEQLQGILNLRDALLRAYEFYPDGEVVVELIIKDEMVNV
jgi:hypothetical protein